MFIITTPRLQLIPLNARQMRLFRENPPLSLELLGIEPYLLTTDDSYGNNIEAARDRWEASLEADPDNFPWHTTWHIVLTTENKRIGRLGFSGIPETEYGITQIGYSMDINYWNNGYMTEAVHAAIDWAFQHQECQYVLAETYTNNYGSHRVLEKCGFGILENPTLEGHILWGVRNGNFEEENVVAPKKKEELELV